MSETAERLWNALHGGETVSNDKVKPKLPERIRYAADNKNYACIDPKCKAHHDAEYVRADLLATVRREALREAILIIDTAPGCHSDGKWYIDPVVLVQRMNVELEASASGKEEG